MFRLAVLVAALIGIVVSVSLGFLMLVTWEVASILVTASIGAPSLVLAYLSLKEKRESGKT